MNAQPNFQWVAVLGIALAITPFALVKLQAEPPIGITPNSNPAATTLENRVFTVLNQDDDVAALKAKIKSLEAENRRLKAQSSNRSRADLSRDIRVHEAAAREEVARAQTLERNALKQRTEELARLRQAEAAENSVQVDRQRDLARRDADIARRDLDLARERAEKDQAVEKSRADLALRDADLAQERQKRALVEAQNRDLALAEVEKARVLVEQSQARNRDIETALEDRVRASQRKEDTGLRERREFEQVRRAQKSTVDAQIRQLRDQNRVLQQQMRELQNQIKELQKQKATAVRP